VVLGVAAGGRRGGCAQRTGHEAERVDGLGDVVLRYRRRFAGVGRLQPREEVGVRDEAVCDLVQPFGPLLGRQPAPLRRRGDRGGDRGVGVLGRALGDLGDCAPGARVDDGSGPPDEPGRKVPPIKCRTGGNSSSRTRLCRPCARRIIGFFVVLEMDMAYLRVNDRGRRSALVPRPFGSGRGHRLQARGQLRDGGSRGAPTGCGRPHGCRTLAGQCPSAAAAAQRTGRGGHARRR
jgi:hypothetical protein